MINHANRRGFVGTLFLDKTIMPYGGAGWNSSSPWVEYESPHVQRP